MFRSQDCGNNIKVLDLRQWASNGTNWLATHGGFVFTRAPSSMMDEFAKTPQISSLIHVVNTNYISVGTWKCR